MKKLVSLSLVTFLFLGVLSTNSMSMDDDDALPVVAAAPQREVRVAKVELPLEIRRQNFNAALTIQRRALGVLGKTPEETTARSEAYLWDSGYYSLKLLEGKRGADGTVPRKPNRALGGSKALLDIAARAYQAKNRDLREKLRYGSSRNMLNPYYTCLISDAFFKIEVRGGMVHQDYGSFTPVPKRPEAVRLINDHHRGKTEKKTGGCCS